MSEPFDPYYQWLGIAPAHQPVDHYRLLGLAPLESDPQVIRAAADQRFTYLRTFQLSKHADVAERLLNEMAAAKACLLDPEKKARYDATLGATRKPAPATDSNGTNSLGTRPQPAPLLASPLSSPPPPPPPILPPLRSAPPRLIRPALLGSASRQTTWIAIAIGSALAVGTLVVVAMLSTGNTPRPVALTTSHSPATQPQPAQPVEVPPKTTATPAPSVSPQNPAPEPSAGEHPAWPSVIAGARPALVRILASSGSVSQSGMGFLIDSRGIVVTNSHLVHQARHLQVTFVNGLDASVLGQPVVDLGKDLALVRIATSPLAPQPLRLARSEPAPKQPVLALGLLWDHSRPAKAHATVADVRLAQEIFDSPAANQSPGGVFAGADFDPSARWIETFLPVSQFQTGSPLIGPTGEVVGLCTWLGRSKNGIGYALSSIELQRALAAVRLEDFSQPTPSKDARLAPAAASQPVDSLANVQLPDGSIRLSSGQLFRESMITVDRDAASRLKSTAQNRNDTVLALVGRNQFKTAYVEFEQRRGHEDDSLQGTAVACDTDGHAIYQATYETGKRHGWAMLWTPSGQRIYACQYDHGNRQGPACLFKNDQLRLLVQFDAGRRTASVLLTGGKVAALARNNDEAANQQDLQNALATLAELDANLESTASELEGRFRAKLADLARRREQEERRKAASANSSAARDRIQDRIKGRADSRDGQLQQLQRKAIKPGG